MDIMSQAKPTTAITASTTAAKKNFCAILRYYDIIKMVIMERK